MTQLVIKKSIKRDETPQQTTIKLRKSMQHSPVRTDPEAARKFLSMLSMYDENGQLKEDY